MSQTKPRGDFAVRLDAQNAIQLRKFVTGTGWSRLLEDHRHVFPLNGVELYGDEAFDSVYGVAP